jgi:hypothetical protein
MISKVGFKSKSLMIFLVAFLLFSTSGVWAKPTTSEQATQVVSIWLGLDAQPLGAPMGRQIKEVQTFPGPDGALAYYVVYLNPAGLVFVPADDLVEPIIGFLSEGVYDPGPANPLGALVSQDIPGRVLKAREMKAQALEAGEALTSDSPWAVAQRKWARLANPNSVQEAANGLTNVSDLRVAPFVQSRWAQAGADGSWPPNCTSPCYNYYTPPYMAGSGNNYPCGCTATAMAQLMRYWQYPTTGVGTSSYTITVDGISQSANLRGGSGNGGPYDWANMVLDPRNSGVTEIQRQAIGSLTHDAGLAVHMSYTLSASTGWPYGTAFINTFKYSNGITGGHSGSNIPDINRNAMINPNLHAQYPVIIVLDGPSGGHSVIGDGYGYNYSTMYHHLLIGRAGTDDAWYNLPNVVTSAFTFDSVKGCTYNVFVSGKGEIIAGRVMDAAGNPLSGATVTAAGGGQTFPAIQKDVVRAPTGSSGVYAIPNVPSGATVTVRVTKSGYTFTPKVVTVGSSVDSSIITGNVWGVDFIGTRSRPPLPHLLLLIN